MKLFIKILVLNLLLVPINVSFAISIYSCDDLEEVSEDIVIFKVQKEACQCFLSSKKSIIKKLTNDSEGQKIVEEYLLDISRIERSLPANRIFPTVNIIHDNLSNIVDAKITRQTFPDVIILINSSAFSGYCKNEQNIDSLVFKELLRASHYNINDSAIYVANQLYSSSARSIKFNDIDYNSPLTEPELALFGKYSQDNQCNVISNSNYINGIPKKFYSEEWLDRIFIYECLKMEINETIEQRRFQNRLDLDRAYFEYNINEEMDAMIKEIIMENLDI